MNISHIVAAFLNIAPIIIVLWLTFKDYLKSPGYLSVITGVFIFSGVTFISTYIYFTKPMTPGFMVIITLLSMFLGVFIFNAICRYNFMQSLFIVFIGKCYMDDINLLSIVVYYLIKRKPMLEPDFLHLIILLLIIIITSPMLLLFFQKLMKPAINCTEQINIWKYFSVIPICVTLVYSSMIFPVYKDNISIPTVHIYLIPVTWIILTSLTYIILLKTIIESTKNRALTQALEQTELMLSIQEKQAETLQNRIQETRRIRHDFRHTLNLLDSYLEAGDYNQMKDYIHQYMNKIDIASPVLYCNNVIVNFLVSHYENRAKENQIDFTPQIKMFDKLPLSNIDFCILLGNLLENALEACIRQHSGKRFINLNIRSQNENTLIIIVTNSYSGQIQQKDETFFSSKKEGRVGIGIVSIRGIASKYNGVANFKYSDGVFKASVLLSSKEPVTN